LVFYFCTLVYLYKNEKNNLLENKYKYILPLAIILIYLVLNEIFIGSFLPTSGMMKYELSRNAGTNTSNSCINYINFTTLINWKNYNPLFCPIFSSIFQYELASNLISN